MQSKINHSSAGDGNAEIAKKPRKRRPRTSQQQLVVLNEAYIIEPMPCASYREALGKQVNLSTRSIQIWFQNKRQKLKMEENKIAFEEHGSHREKALEILSKLYGLTSNPNSPMTLCSTNDPAADEIEKAAHDIGVSPNTIVSWYTNQFLKTYLLSSSDAVNIKNSTDLGGLTRVGSSASIASSVGTSAVLERPTSAPISQAHLQTPNHLMMLSNPSQVSQTPTVVYLPASDIAGLSQQEVQEKISKGTLQPFLVFNSGEQASQFQQQQQIAEIINSNNLQMVNTAGNHFANFSANDSDLNVTNTFSCQSLLNTTLNTNVTQPLLYRKNSEENLSSPEAKIDNFGMSDHETIISTLDENESLYNWSESDFGNPRENQTPFRQFNIHHGNHPYMNAHPSFLPRVSSRENVRGMGIRRVSSSIQLQKRLYPQVAMIPNSTVSCDSSPTTLSNLRNSGMRSGSIGLPTESEDKLNPICLQPHELESACQPDEFLNFFSFGSASRHQQDSFEQPQSFETLPNMSLLNVDSNYQALSTTPPSSILSRHQLKSLSLPNLFALDLKGNMDRQQKKFESYTESKNDNDDLDFDVVDEFLSFGR